MIKWLANGQDATASDPANPTPMVSLLQSPRPGAPSSEWIKHRDEVRDILSRGRAVAILRGVVDGPGYTWDEESLVLLTDRRKDATPLEWQCKCFGINHSITICLFHAFSRTEHRGVRETE